MCSHTYLVGPSLYRARHSIWRPTSLWWPMRAAVRGCESRNLSEYAFRSHQLQTDTGCTMLEWGHACVNYIMNVNVCTCLKYVPVFACAVDLYILWAWRTCRQLISESVQYHFDMGVCQRDTACLLSYCHCTLTPMWVLTVSVCAV